MARSKSLIYGFGVNDADYAVHSIVNGKQFICPIYQKWHDMLKRCYSEKEQKRRPTYEGCKVSIEWHTFSIFKAWLERQDWKGNHLDKDMLVLGNKIYSPDTCVLISQKVNTFLNDCSSSRGNWLIGATFIKRTGKFSARCCNPFTKKNESLGNFPCDQQAHLAWKKRKHEIACQLADIQTDPRVANALRVRYA
jgi:hypothetical protein